MIQASATLSTVASQGASTIAEPVPITSTVTVTPEDSSDSGGTYGRPVIYEAFIPTPGNESKNNPLMILAIAGIGILVVALAIYLLYRKFGKGGSNSPE